MEDANQKLPKSLLRVQRRLSNISSGPPLPFLFRVLSPLRSAHGFVNRSVSAWNLFGNLVAISDSRDTNRFIWLRSLWNLPIVPHASQQLLAAKSCCKEEMTGHNPEIKLTSS
ncbi:hypothetical protein MLD38_036652 [Melastoma candidum]|uniref:Uncharacterized protein n=1 Tax=Melastoma candidum TaxID=119954 RepID=A0ACB9LJV9_9MYRT|nr:hypothetical protein MLD38_036652 [Melastoma candidum]